MRRKFVRRFEARYGVGQMAIEEEAKAFLREVDDYRLLSLTDLLAKKTQYEANCRHDWQRLQQLLSEMPERERDIVQTIFFRDLYLILELYLCAAQSITPQPSPTIIPRRPKSEPQPFAEWLFEMEPAKGGRRGK